jgi:hypothetical protein
MVDRSKSFPRRGLTVALCALILFLIISLLRPPQTEAEEVPTLADQEFERLSLQLSEEPGYFDTDNLISNEISYQQVLPRLKEITRAGQVYLGVGPDQNFTYIVQVRPATAIIIDLRRDNLLQHLFFKQVIEASKDRWQYLSLLFGKESPQDFRPDPSADVNRLVQHFRSLSSDQDFFEQNFLKIWSSIQRRFPRLTREEDRDTFHAIAATFFKENLQLKFRTYGRRARPHYPTYEQLMTQTDSSGEMRNYLNSENDFKFLRKMQLENRIVPVIGDLAGQKAMRNVGEYLKKQGSVVSAFYVSNVEFYLFVDGRFPLFVENVRNLPIDENSVLIRSVFNHWQRHSETLPGYYVTTLLQRIDSLLGLYQERPYRDYWDIVTTDYVPTQVNAR